MKIYVDNLEIHAEQYRERSASLKMFCIDVLQRHDLLGVVVDEPLDWVILLHLAEQAELTIVPFSKDEKNESILEKCKELGCAMLFVNLDNMHRFTDQPSQRNCAGILFSSSGTTGKPKSIFRAWEDIRKEVCDYQQKVGPMLPKTRILACSIAHSFGAISGILCGKANNQTLVLFRYSSIRELMDSILTFPNHALFITPVQLRILEKVAPTTSAFHVVVSSGMVMSRSLFEWVKQNTHHLMQQYGCTEVGCISVATKVTDPQQIGTFLPTIAKRAVIENHILKVKQNKEIIVTHDIVTIDENGELYLQGRANDVINRGGFKIAPSVIESVIELHPAIHEVVVFSVNTREEVCIVAYVVLSEDITEQRLHEWCSERLQSYQLPNQYIPVRQIPTMPSGKISRKFLEEHYNEQS
ncbi:MAG: AMP-binding protein [Bacilli bacterium]